MRVGISGTHGTGKTTLAEELRDLLVITPTTKETERVLPAAEMLGLRSRMNEELLDLIYGDPLLELSGSLETRLDAVLAALGQDRRSDRA